MEQQASAPVVFRNIEKDIEVSKKHKVTSFPDVTEIALTSDLEFIIVACDGIWDCYTNA